jgi:UDP-galactopyranose mutase
LGERGHRVKVLEADTVVGGIPRTAERDGWRFDIGDHRFFTKVDEVEALWHDRSPDAVSCSGRQVGAHHDIWAER